MVEAPAPEPENDPKLRPEKIGTTQLWVMILGAVFGGITLLGFFTFAFIAGSKPEFICNAYTPLAAVFALGAALSAGFIGGAASLTGSLGTTAKDNALIFSAGGGIAVLFIAFFAFNHFETTVCDQADKARERSEDAVIKRFLRNHGLVVHTTAPKSDSGILDLLVLLYNSKQGQKEIPAGHPTRNLFAIPAGDLLDDDRTLRFVYDQSRKPEEFHEPPISIEQLEYKCDPPEIRLEVTFPRSSEP